MVQRSLDSTWNQLSVLQAWKTFFMLKEGIEQLWLCRDNKPFWLVLAILTQSSGVVSGIVQRWCLKEIFGKNCLRVFNRKTVKLLYNTMPEMRKKFSVHNSRVCDNTKQNPPMHRAPLYNTLMEKFLPTSHFFFSDENFPPKPTIWIITKPSPKILLIPLWYFSKGTDIKEPSERYLSLITSLIAFY